MVEHTVLPATIPTGNSSVCDGGENTHTHTHHRLGVQSGCNYSLKQHRVCVSSSPFSSSVMIMVPGPNAFQAVQL